MKKIIGLIALIIAFNLSAQYQVGDVVSDYSWTDDSGEDHSIHELTAAGKVVVLDWGGYN